jgi:hypothetical protein
LGLGAGGASGRCLNAANKLLASRASSALTGGAIDVVDGGNVIAGGPAEMV